jgi:hypothetical protein
MIQSEKQTPEHRAYLALVHEICAGHPLAYRWFEQVLETALVWDHMVDDDAIDKHRADRVFTAITTEWIFNDFFHSHRHSLVPVLMNCISSWKHANKSSKPTDKSYDLYTELPGVLCLLIHGAAGIEKFMPELRAMVEREHWLDMRRDHQPFLIIGLPRSRTAWLAALLTDGDVFCHHELIRSCDNLDEYAGRLMATNAMIVGDSDPALIQCYRHIRPQLPTHKVVFINRPQHECRDALEKVLIDAKIDPAPHMAVWPDLEKMYAEIKMHNPDAMAFDYADLDKEESIKSLVEYCTGLPFNRERWKMFDELKITAIASKVIANQRIIK